MISRLALTFLALISACAHRPPRATAPVRQLTEQGRQLLAAAPQTYASGKSNPGELAQRFATGLSVACAHDERLDALAEVLADTMVSTSQLPARSLTQWLMWREGVPFDLRAVQAWSASGDAEPVLDQSLVEYARTVEADAKGAPLRYGVARALYALGSEWAQIVVLSSAPLDLDAVPKRVARGEKLTLKGRFNVKAVKPQLFLDDSDLKVRELELEPQADGTFTVTFDAPAVAGRRFLELSAFEADETPEHPQWMHPLLMVPLHVDVAEPLEPEDLIRTPAPNPPALAGWASRSLELYNARRSASATREASP